MDILDAQAHIFLTIGMSEALAAMDALGIRSVLIDEVWSIDADGQSTPCTIFADGVRRPMSPLAQAASMLHPDRFSYLQRVDRRDPGLAALMEMLASSPGCRSVRIDLRLPEERQALSEGGYEKLLRLAEQYAMPVSVLGRDVGTAIRDTVAKHTGVEFIVDHCGSTRTPQQWEDILALGPFKNIWMKWSAAQHAFGGTYPFPEIQAQLARALNAFGASRLMWASDFTQNKTGNCWADLLYYLRDSSVMSADDKEWFFARTARTVFRWGAVTAPAVAA